MAQQPQEDERSPTPSRFSEVSGVLSKGSVANSKVMSPFKRNSLLMMAQQQNAKRKPETIEELFSEIQSYIQVIDQRMERVLQKHEKDFLTAYRSHMMKVQKQLDFLRGKADDQEANRRHDQKLNRLQHSLNWFRNQAVNLGKSCQQYRYAKDVWKNKAENLQEDRKFLEFQIRAQHRQNKLLKMDLKKQQQQFRSLRAEQSLALANQLSMKQQGISENVVVQRHFQSEMIQPKFTALNDSLEYGYPATEPSSFQKPPQQIRKSPENDPLHLLPSQIHTVSSQSPKGSPLNIWREVEVKHSIIESVKEEKRATTASPQKDSFDRIAPSVKKYSKTRMSQFVLQMIEAQLNIKQLLEAIDVFSEAEQKRHLEQIQTLQHQLDRERERNRSLKQPRVSPNTLTTKGPNLEEIFFQCVQQVKLDTFNRKQKQQLLARGTYASATSSHGSNRKTFSPISGRLVNQSFNIGEVSSFTGTQVVTPVGYLPQISSKREVIFTPEEKRRAIELLLEHQEVIRALNEVIFKTKYQKKMEEQINLFKVEGSAKPQLQGPFDDAVSTATHQALSDKMLRQNYNSLMGNPYDSCIKQPRGAKRAMESKSQKVSATQSRSKLESSLPIVPEAVFAQQQPAPKTANPLLRSRQQQPSDGYSQNASKRGGISQSGSGKSMEKGIVLKNGKLVLGHK